MPTSVESSDGGRREDGASVFRRYKRPREANWLIGVVMFALVFDAIFTGTVIKWDQEGFEALAHNLEVARLLGGAGFWFSAEFSSDLPLIVRLYVAHVAIIPGMIVFLLAIHVLLVKRHGISPHPAIPDVPAELAEPFTHHLRGSGRSASP
jgi:ubiquinol-cytochrome c reductase cytochrome b subunit